MFHVVFAAPPNRTEPTTQSCITSAGVGTGASLTRARRGEAGAGSESRGRGLISFWHLLSPTKEIDLASRGLVLGGGERDAKSRHLLSPNETLDLASRGLVLGGGSGTPNLGTC